MTTCIANDCDRKASAKSLCPKHYYRNKTYGDPDIVRFPWREDRSCLIPDCKREHEAKGYCKNHYMILYKFDISPEEYNNKFVEQNGLCDICNEKCSQKEMLSLDHDHESGIVRGLLCSACNMALGGFKDSIEMLESAIKYLKKWNK
jgi:hypothetical protein